MGFGIMKTPNISSRQQKDGNTFIKLVKPGLRDQNLKTNIKGTKAMGCQVADRESKRS